MTKSIKKLSQGYQVQNTEVGIYKRKKESKKERNHAFEQEKKEENKTFSSVKIILSFFKLPPQIGSIINP